MDALYSAVSNLPLVWEISYRWWTRRSASAVAVPEMRMYFWAVTRSLQPIRAWSGTGATPLYAWWLAAVARRQCG